MRPKYYEGTVETDMQSTNTYSGIYKHYKTMVAVLSAFFRFVKNLLKRAFLLFIVLVIIWAVFGQISDRWELRDKDPYRGAAAITDDPFDQPIAKEDISNLQQGWTSAESMWFYTATQGSNLLPYDFFLHLEQADSKELFRTNKNINKYRYLAQDSTKSNPDALPVGMVKDTYVGKEYMGFNCAACHTSQINFANKAIRIDGGPAASDMEYFILDLTGALEATLREPDKYERFYQSVSQAGGDFHSVGTDIVKNELEVTAIKLRTYTDINTPAWGEQEDTVATHYGFSRLDAFGRIYNRVLQHVVTPEAMKTAIVEFSEDPDSELTKYLLSEVDRISATDDKKNIVARSLELISEKSEAYPELSSMTKENLLTGLFNSADAPVSYPYLWDIPQHDYVQWTGMVSNGGIGPLGRNVGQVIGVFGTLDWQEKDGWSLPERFNALLGGQGFGKTYIDFKSSIDKRNLRRVESKLRKLQSPEWPADLLGILNKDKIKSGAKIFNRYCESCHTNIVRDDKNRRVLVHMSKIDSVGTDPVLAKNTTNYDGYSGMLQGNHVDLAPGKFVVEERMPVASLVKFSSRNVVVEWDADRNPIVRFAQWTWDMLKTLRDNRVKDTVKRGNYPPSSPQQPLAEMNAYKARALNGIWSTAPYLHNGSIPNLYELLLPKKRQDDPVKDEFGNAIEYRSDKFMVGSREFQPDVVGFRAEGYDGFEFDTSIRGNFNTGHEYAAGKTPLHDGSFLPPLSKPQRLELLEYLKSL